LESRLRTNEKEQGMMHVYGKLILRRIAAASMAVYKSNSIYM
jgi:hypothetical protein